MHDFDLYCYFEFFLHHCWCQDSLFIYLFCMYVSSCRPGSALDLNQVCCLCVEEEEKPSPRHYFFFLFFCGFISRPLSPALTVFEAHLDDDDAPPLPGAPGPSHCACAPRHADTRTEQLLLAEEQPAGRVRVYPPLATHLLNIHTGFIHEPRPPPFEGESPG